MRKDNRIHESHVTGSQRNFKLRVLKGCTLYGHKVRKLFWKLREQRAETKLCGFLFLDEVKKVFYLKSCKTEEITSENFIEMLGKGEGGMVEMVEMVRVVNFRFEAIEILGPLRFSWIAEKPTSSIYSLISILNKDNRVLRVLRVLRVVRDGRLDVVVC